MWETGKLLNLRGKFSLQVSFRCLIIKPTVGGVRSFFLPDARWNPEDRAESQTSGLQERAQEPPSLENSSARARFSRTVIASSTWNHSLRHIHRISPIVYYFSDRSGHKHVSCAAFMAQDLVFKSRPRCPL